MGKIIVFGAGMVGSAIALDLAKKHRVTSVDFSEEALEALKKKNPEIQCIKADLQESETLERLASEGDLSVCAVPGFMGYQILERLIRCGKPIVDISFFGENALDLQALALEHNVTAIVDCGVAPGMSNILLGHCNQKMTVDRFECWVGGLPKVRTKPFEYKAPFSPIDVLEEYTRPARFRQRGIDVVKPALSELEELDFEETGTLEAFLSDGLRSLLITMPHIPDMTEKTLRYPGHAALIKDLRQAGFFSTQSVNVNGNSVRPIDLTAELLKKQWKLEPEEPEFTIMRVKVTGKGSVGEPRTAIYDLYDEFDVESGISSMARTTGYTCCAAVELILNGHFQQKGIIPPEFLGQVPICFEEILKYLEERKVLYKEKSS